MSTPASTTRPPSSGPSRRLTLDLGNTQAKLRLWEGEASRPRLVLRAEAPAGEDFGPWLAEVLDGRADGLEAALSSVASRERRRALAQALRERGVQVEEAPETGLHVDCEPPGDVGLDRLYAALGALALAREDPDPEGYVCVCDAGTALTVDLARRIPGAAGEGTFLGGAIAPGPRLLARALAGGTAALPPVEPTPGARALGRSTVDAIRSGTGVGFRGAARELVERCLAESGAPPGTPVFLTGGASDFLLLPEPFLPRPLQREPELVHLGLLRALRRRGESVP